MDKPKIVDALSNASMYLIDGEEFIKRIIAAGVKSYSINIYTYDITFKILTAKR